MSDRKGLDTWAQGPCDGMGNLNPDGEYMRIVVEYANGDRSCSLISLGAAEGLAGVLINLLAASSWPKAPHRG